MKDTVEPMDTTMRVQYAIDARDMTDERDGVESGLREVLVSRREGFGLGLQ